MGTLVEIALRLCAQVFLVGDPNQLPATVISKEALEYGYDVSLFQRLQAAGHPVQVVTHVTESTAAASAWEWKSRTSRSSSGCKPPATPCRYAAALASCAVACVTQYITGHMCLAKTSLGPSRRSWVAQQSRAPRLFMQSAL